MLPAPCPLPPAPCPHCLFVQRQGLAVEPRLTSDFEQPSCLSRPSAGNNAYTLAGFLALSEANVFHGWMCQVCFSGFDELMNGVTALGVHVQGKLMLWCQGMGALLKGTDLKALPFCLQSGCHTLQHHNSSLLWPP